MSVRSAVGFDGGIPKAISTYTFPNTTITLNNNILVPLTGSVILPAGTYTITAIVEMFAGSPLVDFYQTKLVYDTLILQSFQVQYDNLPATPILDNLTVGLSGLVLSDGVSALTIRAQGNGDSGTITVGAKIRYYKLD